MYIYRHICTSMYTYRHLCRSIYTYRDLCRSIWTYRNVGVLALTKVLVYVHLQTHQQIYVHLQTLCQSIDDYYPSFGQPELVGHKQTMRTLMDKYIHGLDTNGQGHKWNGIRTQIDWDTHGYIHVDDCVHQTVLPYDRNILFLIIYKKKQLYML